MFALGNSTFTCGFAALANGRLKRIAVRRKLEEACWRRCATPTAAAGAADTPHRHANRIPSWNSDLRGRYFAWNWPIPVMLATVVATTATLSSNSCKTTIVFYIFYFRSAETVCVNNMFLGEAKSYKWVLALRNSWHIPLYILDCRWDHNCWHVMVGQHWPGSTQPCHPSPPATTIQAFLVLYQPPLTLSLCHWTGRKMTPTIWKSAVHSVASHLVAKFS